MKDGLGTLTVTVDGEGVTPVRDTGPSPDTWTVTAADVVPGANAVHAEADGQTDDQTLTAVVAGAGTYEYDANGNRTQYNAADGSVQRYVYDRENRLTTIYYDATASAPRSVFTYDGLGRRIAVTEYDAVGAVTSAQRYLYDGLDLVEVRDASDDTLAQIVHGPGIDNPLVMVDVTESPVDKYYYHTDHLGSVRLITDDTGAAARTYDYSAYGVLLAESGTGASLNPFHYTGREYHAESGLYFYRARFYDPEVGSFISVDPIGQLGGANGYRYAAANPLAFIDSLGWYPLTITGGGTLLSGITADYRVTDPSELRQAIADSIARHPGEQITEFTLIAHGDSVSGGEIYLGSFFSAGDGRLLPRHFADDELGQFTEAFAPDARITLAVCFAAGRSGDPASEARGQRLLDNVGRAFLRQNGGVVQAFHGKVRYVPGLGVLGRNRIRVRYP